MKPVPKAPLSLVAELTHRCPLHCVYCSNPLEMQVAERELPTEDWVRILRQAGEMGVLHAHFTGGEPLARRDLVELVGVAREAGLYVNLITSGIGLTAEQLDALVKAGVDHIQLSLQDANEEKADEFAGAHVHARKLATAELIWEYSKRHNIGFTVNVVVHRGNLDRLEEMIALAESMRPQRLEIAHVQYYGWALSNRASLMPTRQQVDRAIAIVAEAEERLRGKIQIQVALPDYYARYPKACVGGWGRQLMLIDPAGQALPCHAAGIIPGIAFDSVRDHSLAWLWQSSPAFQRFRGDEWMVSPCRECDRREQDFGGCRCQAFQLTGHAENADPACSLSPDHEKLVAIANAAPRENPLWIYRQLAVK